MPRTAKLFMTGRSQAVRLPREFRFSGQEVYIRRDPVSGDVVLSQRPETWDDFFALCDATPVPRGFLGPKERASVKAPPRDPFKDWVE